MRVKPNNGQELLSPFITSSHRPGNEGGAKKLAKAHRALAELKGITGIVPNQKILVSTLSLQEAKDSSAVENIVTTHDDLFKGEAFGKQFASAAAKEVQSYAVALRGGFEKVIKRSLLTNTHILEIQQTLVNNSAGFRKMPGTELKNDITGQTVYVPPQDPNHISELMANLVSTTTENDPF